MPDEHDLSPAPQQIPERVVRGGRGEAAASRTPSVRANRRIPLSTTVRPIRLTRQGTQEQPGSRHEGGEADQGHEPAGGPLAEQPAEDGPEEDGGIVPTR